MKNNRIVSFSILAIVSGSALIAAEATNAPRYLDGVQGAVTIASETIEHLDDELFVFEAPKEQPDPLFSLDQKFESLDAIVFEHEVEKDAVSQEPEMIANQSIGQPKDQAAKALKVFEDIEVKHRIPTDDDD